MDLDRVRVKLRRNWLAVRAFAGRPAVLAAARRAGPGLHHVVVPPRVLDTYEETVEGIADALRRLGRGAAVHRVSDLARVRPLRPGDRVIVFGAHRFAPWTPPAGVLLVGVNVEQYPEDWSPGDGSPDAPLRTTAVLHMAKTDRFLAGCHLLLECNECLFEESARLGRPAAGVLPFAFTPRFLAGSRFEPGATPVPDPPFDVAFLGRPGDGRRKEALARLAREFRLAPSTVAWGRRRAQFLRSAKIQLNLHQGEKPVLEGHRFAVCFAAGAFVLSEPLPANAPFKAGLHHVEAPLADWPATIREWLARPADRRRIAATGRRFFREEYTFEQALARLLPILDAAADPERARTRIAQEGRPESSSG